MSAIQIADDKQSLIWSLLAEKHGELAQTHRPISERTITARNYNSSIAALGEYLREGGTPLLPTKGTLTRWRDDMRDHLLLNDGAPYSPRTINARMSAIRKLLRDVADDCPDLELKFMIRDWSTVEDVKLTVEQDKTEEDYGRRLTLTATQNLMWSIPKETLKGLRDRAIIALGLGAGLRVSEIVSLRLADVFSVTADGKRGIRVRKGKHNKSRIVVIGNWNSWVFQACLSYTNAIGLTPEDNAEERLIRGVKPLKDHKYKSSGISLTSRNAQTILEAPEGYQAFYDGVMTFINFHDLRRTYAKLCRMSGMSWDALRLNMGHSSITITEKYVGTDVDWDERVPSWSIEL